MGHRSAPIRGKRWLVMMARALASELRAGAVGTSLRIRIPSRAGDTNTDGWRAVVGDLGERRPRLARTLPGAKAEDETRDVYPQIENRMLVVSHLRRERSSLLAAERKIQDDHRCQVCQFRFTDLYGEMGKLYAEAHHRVPLSQLRGTVRTNIEDLVTVCANCHRMLHRMPGRRNDVTKLRSIVRAHRTKRL